MCIESEVLCMLCEIFARRVQEFIRDGQLYINEMEVDWTGTIML